MGKNYFNSAQHSKMKLQEKKQTLERDFCEVKPKRILGIQNKNWGEGAQLIHANILTLDATPLKLSEALTESSCRKYFFFHETVVSHSTKTNKQFKGSLLPLELLGLAICREILPFKQDCSVLKADIPFFKPLSPAYITHISSCKKGKLSTSSKFSCRDSVVAVRLQCYLRQVSKGPSKHRRRSTKIAEVFDISGLFSSSILVSTIGMNEQENSAPCIQLSSCPIKKSGFACNLSNYDSDRQYLPPGTGIFLNDLACMSYYPQSRNREDDH